MDTKDGFWFLVLDQTSTISKTWGAYKLETVMKCKEMKLLPKYDGW